MHSKERHSELRSKLPEKRELDFLALVLNRAELRIKPIASNDNRAVSTHRRARNAGFRESSEGRMNK